MFLQCDRIYSVINCFIEVRQTGTLSNRQSTFKDKCMKDTSEEKPIGKTAAAPFRNETTKFTRIVKRFLDIVCSILGLILMAIPMLIISIAIKIDSRGPVIFKSERVGKNKKPFTIYKFRSMDKDAPLTASNKIDVKYTTKVGKFLRRTSLDEIPQLLCVLKGDMSLVGPRPVIPAETDLIAAREKTGAYTATPGITGLAQINGRDLLVDVVKKAEFDGRYARKITIRGDIKIICKTFVKVIRGDDIVEGSSDK